MVWWREFFGCASGYPCPTITPKKGEIPASMMTRGGGLKRFCSELISSLSKTATSELASPEDLRTVASQARRFRSDEQARP